MKKDIKPLESDPKRQASNAIRGYTYQVWQSLYSWIHLEDDEVLSLEGTEDMDQLSPDSSTTIQVKHLSKNITLRSPEVIQAISNYWKLKQKEDRDVVFQLLTSASRGKEQHNPFNGQKGLDYWDKCRKGKNLSLLKNFLLKIDKFPKDLKNFIENSSNSDFVKKLIMPIRWLTKSGNLDDVRKKVEESLILHGNKLGFTASDSKRAATELLDIVWITSCNKKLERRSLRKVDFLRAFDSSLQESVSKSELRIMRSLAVKTLDSLLSQNSLLQKNPGGNVITNQISKPHMSDKKLFIAREHLIKKASSLLSKVTLLQIRGSSGMGKSILSLQLVENHLDEWERISFRNLEGKNINDILNSLCNPTIYKPRKIILDDINFNQDSKLYSDSFERFVRLLADSGGKIIVTSQKKIPYQLILRLDLSKNNDVLVPKFSRDEVIKLLKLNSCPNADVSLWIKDIEITTKLHPQLAHARIRRLKKDGWNKSKAIFQTEELVEIQQEVVGNLLSELPSKESRDLLLRLSILSGSFKRKNALSLASYPVTINTPGIFFNQLVGPYVEQVTEEYYQLSPLLDNAFKTNFNDEEIKNLHSLAGESYLSKTLTPNDLSNIFLHGVAGGSGRILYYAFAAFQSISGKYKKLIYPHLEWLIAIHIGTGKKAFEADEVMSLMFRSIQFNIAVELKDHKSALKIADAWFNEVKTFTGKGPFEKQKESKTFPLMFYLSVFRHTTLEIPIHKCIEWITSAYDFLRKNPEVNSAFKPPSNKTSLSWKELMPEVALTKRINSSNIEEFMLAITNSKAGVELLRVINKSDMLPKRIVDNVWLDEIDKETPDWQSALLTLNKLKRFSIDKKAFNIAALAIRAIAIIKNEYIQNQPGAQKVLFEGVKKLGKHPELINYKAKIAFIDRNYKKALEIWETVLPDLYQQADLTASFAYRDAAVCAANLSDWKTAAQYFKQAATFAKEYNENVYSTQCLADYGFALWKLESYSECIKVFTQVVDSFLKLPSPKTNLRMLGLLKMISNTFIHFQKTINPNYREIGQAYTKPYAGAHSQTDFSEKLRELPIPPSISLWMFLAEIEQELGVGNIAYTRLMEIYDQLPVLFQAGVKKIQIIKSLRSNNLSKIVQEIVLFFALTHKTMMIENGHEAVLMLTKSDINQSLDQKGSVMVHVLSHTLLSFVAVHPFEELPPKEWSKSAKKYGLNKCKEWDDFIKNISAIDQNKSHVLVKDGDADIALRVLASIYILTHDDDRDYSLYASALLTTSLKDYSVFCWELDDYLVGLLTERWKDLASTLFETWHDKESKLVLDSCSDTSSSGIQKAAKIVLAAEGVAFLKINAVKSKLLEIAKVNTS